VEGKDFFGKIFYQVIWRVIPEMRLQYPTNFSLLMAPASNLLPEGGDKLLFVGYFSRRLSADFSRVGKVSDQPSPFLFLAEIPSR
jgi:hypothetical protein